MEILPDTSEGKMGKKQIRILSRVFGRQVPGTWISRSEIRRIELEEAQKIREQILAVDNLLRSAETEAPNGIRKATMKEAGWVIERHVNSELRFWTGHKVTEESFVADHNKAVRFARFEDGAVVLSWCLGGIGRVAEHAWESDASSN